MATDGPVYIVVNNETNFYINKTQMVLGQNVAYANDGV